MGPKVSLCLLAAKPDREHVTELEKHLILSCQPWIVCSRVVPDEVPQTVRLARLWEADLIGVLLSADLFYSCGLELAVVHSAMESGIVIPILLRDTGIAVTFFSPYECAPRGGKPIIRWSSQDQAWVEVTRAILSAAERVREQRSAGPRPSRPPPVRPPGNGLSAILPGLWEIVVKLGGEDGSRIAMEIGPLETPIFYAAFRDEARLPWSGTWTSSAQSILLDGRRGHRARLQVSRFGPDRLEAISAIGEHLLWQRIGS